MRLNFKKISAIASSVLLAGMTMGVAAAANYPAPFVSGSTADVAIVYGTGPGVNALDKTYAGNIQADLADEIDGTTTTTVSGGEIFTLEKSSDNFNFADNLSTIYGTLDNDEMAFLADNGEYDDGEIDEEYDETITLSSKTLELFADNNYKNDEPTVGFWWENGDEILSYEIDFDDDLNYTKMVDTEMPLLGGKYYVIDASSTQIDILDSAQKTVIEEGETVTVNGKTVEISYISSDEVVLNVDGDDTNKLEEGEYDELDDGTYVVLTENYYAEKETGTSKVEFSLGAGKIELINGTEIEVNDDDVDGMEVIISDSSSLLDKLTITWKSDDDTFLTADTAISMPIFESVSLSYEGLDYPSDSEMITFSEGDTFVIEMDNYDFDALFYNGTDAFLGAEDHELVLATSVQNFTSPAVNLTGGLHVAVDDRFVVTRIDDDLGECETLYYEVSDIENDSTSHDITVELEDISGGDDDISFDAIESEDQGDFTISLVAVNGTDADTTAYLTFSATGTIAYDRIVSDKGLVITLPTDADYATNSTGAAFTLTEANEDGDVDNGYSWTVNVKNTSNDEFHVSTHSLTSYQEEESDDNYIGIVPSDLASSFTWDKSNDEYQYDVEYFGEEVVATVNVIAGAEVSMETSGLGGIVIMDTEVDKMDDKNLIVVGGSCINSVAATLLGDSLCGAAFTAVTGVSAGEYMIKSYANPYDEDKVALLVAGYNVEDTKAASDYLITQTVDSSSVDYKGTTGTLS